MKHVTKSATVPHTAASLYNLVNDINKYPEFLPWCSASKITSQHSNEIVASMTLHKGGLQKSFTTRNELIPYHRIEMHLINGPFKHLYGLWTFEEDNKHHCKVQIDITYAFDNTLIAMMIGPVFNRIANTLLDAFVQRAHEVCDISTIK